LTSEQAIEHVKLSRQKAGTSFVTVKGKCRGQGGGWVLCSAVERESDPNKDDSFRALCKNPGPGAPYGSKRATGGGMVDCPKNVLLPTGAAWRATLDKSTSQWTVLAEFGLNGDPVNSAWQVDDSSGQVTKM
jgi:hypothetical protein